MAFDAPIGKLKIEYAAEVEVHYERPEMDLGESPVNQVPDEVLHFLSPTRYC